MKKLEITNFVDPHFPPRDTSIHCFTEPYPYKQIIQWRRPHEFMSNPQIFQDNIDPNDIKQGYLPDCWFLSALSSLAERPGLVRRLILTKEYNKEGIYRVKLCKNGEWVVVTIDDYIPCYYNGGPIFSRANGEELWVLLLEKAYAKMHGCYYSLRYGFTHHGMIDLTGCPTYNINFPEEKPSFRAIEEEANKIWEKILESDSQGFLISGETPGYDEATEGGGQNAASGLVPGHAYSIIQAKEGLGEKLLNIRNPWGRYEWDGDWWDNDEKWTDEFIEEFKPVFDSNDGSFWMCLEDFIMRFSSVNICQVKNWDEIRLKGKFIRAKEKKEEGGDYVLSRFYYTFEVEDDDTEVHISLHQEDNRVLGADRRGYLDVSIALLKLDPNDSLDVYSFSDFVVERELQMSYNLNAGKYILVPLSTGALLQQPFNASRESIEFKVKFDNILMPHPYFLSTLNDIYRKVDLSLNEILSAEELNQFGRIIGEKAFIDIKQKDFTSEKFKNLSCGKEGLTNLGFKQFLFRNFEADKIPKILEKLGYDKGLYSNKSRVFVVSIQSEQQLTVKIEDSLLGEMHKRVMDMFMHHVLDHNVPAESRESTSRYCFFQYYHSKWYGSSFGIANLTSSYLKVNLDMTESESWYYSPKSGVSNVIVKPNSLCYLGSWISDPEIQEVNIMRSYDVEDYEPEEGEEPTEENSEQSEED